MYNEEKGASACVDSVIRIISKMKHTKIFVIDDGSKDSTAQILKEKSKKYKSKLLILSHNKNKGYGKALQTGIRFALKQGFGYGLFMDSDLTNDPKYIRDFAKTIPANYDCVKASRFIKGGKMVGVPLYRKFFSKIANLITRALFKIGIHDLTNGFRMVKLSMIKDIMFKENDFSIILEELYILKKKNAKFYEIPTILTARRHTKSHFTYNPRLFWDYLKYAIKASMILI